MNFNDRFNETEKIYQDLCHQVTNPGNFFFTSRYAELRQIALDVSSQLNVLNERLLDVLLDEDVPADYKNLHSYLCYTRKHLKIKESKDMDQSKYEKCSWMLDTTIRLGLMIHLFLVLNDSRKKCYSKMDLDTLETEWTGRILRSDKLFRRYNVDVKKLPDKIFEAYYKNYITPILKDDFGIDGFLKNKKQHDYFLKIFTSGILLGLESDVACRKAKAGSKSKA